jgi:hypothetical protein
MKTLANKSGNRKRKILVLDENGRIIDRIYDPLPNQIEELYPDFNRMLSLEVTFKQFKEL